MNAYAKAPNKHKQRLGEEIWNNDEKVILLLIVGTSGSLTPVALLVMHIIMRMVHSHKNDY